MLKEMPTATVVPVVMDNFWRFEQYKLRPMPFAIKPACTVLPPIDRSGKTNDEVIEEVETLIRMELGL